MDVMSSRPAKIIPLAASPGSVNADSFLARVIADRIVWISCCQKTALVPNTSLGTRNLWLRFGGLIDKHLRQLNYDLVNVEGNHVDHLMKKRIFERIYDLMEAEVCLLEYAKKRSPCVATANSP